MSDSTEAFERALLSMDRLTAEKILGRAREGRTAIQLTEEVIAPALERIGEGWRKGSVALSQVYMSGRICEDLVESVLPPEAEARKAHPPIAITTLKDYHLLGKRIVCSILRADGYNVTDYGRTSVDELVERVGRDRVRVLLISALMLPSALQVKDVKAGLIRAGVNVSIVVGGAPFLFDGELWREVGAEAMGKSASEAIRIIRELTGGAS